MTNNRSPKVGDTYQSIISRNGHGDKLQKPSEVQVKESILSDEVRQLNVGYIPENNDFNRGYEKGYNDRDELEATCWRLHEIRISEHNFVFYITPQQKFDERCKQINSLLNYEEVIRRLKKKLDQELEREKEIKGIEEIERYLTKITGRYRNLWGNNPWYENLLERLQEIFSDKR